MVDRKRKRARPEDYFSDWKEREALAEAMIPLIGKLYRQNVQTCIYGIPLINISVLEIMKAHRFVREVEENELSEFETYPVLQALSEINDLGSAEVDVGQIAVLHSKQAAQNSLSIQEFVALQVESICGLPRAPISRPRDVVLFGFGRVGRLVARILIENTGGGSSLRLRAVVVRGGPEDLEKRTNLLRMDSVHGPFHGTIRVDPEHASFVANGNEVRVISGGDPANIDYTEYGVHDAIIVDNTGKWRTRDSLAVHLQNRGAARVLLTAPGKGDVKNIVHGVNHNLIEAEDTILSASSCTTNAIALPLKIIEEAFGIEYGHLETVHAYTNDQNLIDNYHSARRRGRSAALNLVLTETGAAAAVAKVYPAMAGKLTGNAIRVPLPNVSLAILHLRLKQEVDVDMINQHMRKIALHSKLSRQVDYTNSPEVVSSDFVGSRYACVFDSEATIVHGRDCVLYLWYDNEFGYAWQVYRVLEEMAGIRYVRCPEK